MVLVQSHTPVASLTERVRFRSFSDRRVSRLQAVFVVGSSASQWRQDSGIWSCKIHRDRPLLAPGDGAVRQLLRWYAQFHPKRAMH
jgi:hypothetical protein